MQGREERIYCKERGEEIGDCGVKEEWQVVIQERRGCRGEEKQL